jgi:hypothetical protein
MNSIRAARAGEETGNSEALQYNHGNFCTDGRVHEYSFVPFHVTSSSTAAMLAQVCSM